MDKMFYFYHVAHMAKHFEIGGCGVRPFLDSYLLLYYAQYRTESCCQLLRKGGLLTFAKAVKIWRVGGENLKDKKRGRP